MGKMIWWNVMLNGKEIDSVPYDASYESAEEVKTSLVNHDGYDPITDTWASYTRPTDVDGAGIGWGLAGNGYIVGRPEVPGGPSATRRYSSDTWSGVADAPGLSGRESAHATGGVK